MSRRACFKVGEADVGAASRGRAYVSNYARVNIRPSLVLWRPIQICRRRFTRISGLKLTSLQGSRSTGLSGTHSRFSLAPLRVRVPWRSNLCSVLPSDQMDKNKICRSLSTIQRKKQTPVREWEQMDTERKSLMCRRVNRLPRAVLRSMIRRK
jgi:hypothetical protein